MGFIELILSVISFLIGMVFFFKAWETMTLACEYFQRENNKHKNIEAIRSSLPEIDDQAFCSECGASVGIEDKFCKACGADISVVINT